jgi:hypothetical protein
MRTLLLLLLSSLYLSGQSEISWSINLNIQQITQADKRIFATLEKDLTTFLNSRTWTDDRFEPDERIDAILFLTLAERNDPGGEGVLPDEYKATLAIQTSRPVYGVGELTPVLNYQDKDVLFGYEQYEAIELSEQGYTTNLASILGFYSYLLLGLDYDTFSPLGGQPYYERAQAIYNLLPAGVAGGPGWTSVGNAGNRYFLLENLLSGRMLPVRRALYTYHRLGLDLMLTDPLSARKNIMLAIEDLQAANQAYPNSELIQAFVDAKREEIIEIFKGATGVEQNTVIDMMTRIDPSQAGRYREIRETSSSRGRVGRR